MRAAQSRPHSAFSGFLVPHFLGQHCRDMEGCDSPPPCWYTFRKMSAAPFWARLGGRGFPSFEIKEKRTRTPNRPPGYRPGLWSGAVGNCGGAAAALCKAFLRDFHPPSRRRNSVSATASGCRKTPVLKNQRKPSCRFSSFS